MKGCLQVILVIVVLAVLGNWYYGFRGSPPPTPISPPATVSTPAPAASKPAIQWSEGVSSDGLSQRWADMSFEVCVVTKSTTLAKLNVPPSRVREIINTGMMTMTRVCLDDGTSLLITCSKPDQRMIITESPHGADVGCPS